MKKSRLLKKEKNNTSTSSLSAGRGSILPLKHKGSQRGFEQNPSYTFPYALREGQTGRSMVEMLGVLAVMGVLSVAGIAGFNSAMNKHRANELINEASKRAVMVAAQAMVGKTGTISLGEFGNNSVSGATFGASATIENNQITMTLSGVADPICTQMKVALGDNAIMAVDNKCTILAFNADMTKGVTKPASCDPACTGGRKCVADNTCGCPSDKPIWNGIECQVKATCDADQYYFVGSNFCDEEQVCDEAVQYSNYTKNTTNKMCTCPSGTYGYPWMDFSYDCCPEGYPIIMGKCATSKTCDGTWYCNGELTKDKKNCIDSVECCNGVIIHDSTGWWQYCCPSESPVYDPDGGCTPCTGGQQGFSSNGDPICQCATGYHFDYENAKDCVADE